MRRTLVRIMIIAVVSLSLSAVGAFANGVADTGVVVQTAQSVEYASSAFIPGTFFVVVSPSVVVEQVSAPMIVPLPAILPKSVREVN